MITERESGLHHELDGKLTTMFVAADMNCDGTAENFDVHPFVLALSNPAAHAAARPNRDILNGDVNGNGVVDNSDINPSVAALNKNGAVVRKYTWDAENRVAAVGPGTSPAAGICLRLHRSADLLRTCPPRLGPGGRRYGGRVNAGVRA